MFAVLITSSASSFGVAQVVISMCVLALCAGVVKLPTKSRRIVTSAVVAVLGAGVGVALAVPYHCDPVWKYFGWC